MSTTKLAKIAEQKAKLEQEYQAALAERKQRIGELAEKSKLLEMSDHFFAGLFQEAQKATAEHIKKLEASGSSALTPKRSTAQKAANA